MTTFQAVVYGIIQGFAEFLPISAPAHHTLVPYLTGWPQPSGPFAGVLALGALAAVLIYFRHDWASIISCFLQVILFRKRPMTLDEHLPIFLALSSLPPFLVWYFFRESIGSFFDDPIWVVATLLAFGIPLWLADSSNRRNKGMFDWNWFDSLFVGFAQTLMFIPGCGRMTGALLGGLSRNYNRPSAAKYGFFAAAPILAGSAFLNLKGLDFKAASPMPDLSWFTLSVAGVVTLLSGLLAIGGLMKQVQSKGFGGYILYRCVFAGGVAVALWFRAGPG